MKTLASVTTRRDRCYLFGRRAARLTEVQAAAAWFALAEKVEAMGEMDVPKFNDILIAVEVAGVRAKQKSKIKPAMKPVYQTTFGKLGNCWPACLATIFEVPIEEVDRCACHHADTNEQTEAWLAKRGLFPLEIEVFQKNGQCVFPIASPPDGMICVVTGKRAGKSLSHAVVCRVRHGKEISEKLREITFEVLHDPLGDKQPFAITERIIFFCKIMN